MSAYVVEINEGKIEVSRQGADFWHLHRQRFVASGQLAETTPACFVGGLAELGPWDRETADFMADHMITSGGMPKTAVRVKRPATSPAVAPGEAGAGC